MKETVTLPVESVETNHRLAADGKADSVSGFVQYAVHVSLDDVGGWGALFGKTLADTGVAMTDQERHWADQVLGGPGSAGTRGVNSGVTLHAGRGSPWTGRTAR